MPTYYHNIKHYAMMYLNENCNNQWFRVWAAQENFYILHHWRLNLSQFCTFELGHKLMMDEHHLLVHDDVIS